MLLQQRQPDRTAFDRMLQQNLTEIRSLRRKYSITPQEEEWILNGLSSNAGNFQKAEYLLTRLSELNNCSHALNQPLLQQYQAVVNCLQESVHHKQELMVQTILETLAALQGDPNVISLAQSLKQYAPLIVVDLLEWGHGHISPKDGRVSQRLQPEIVQFLTQPRQPAINNSLESSPQEILNHLEVLLQHYNPLIQAATLYLIAQLDSERARTIVRDRYYDFSHPLVQETAERVLTSPTPGSLTEFPKLEKLVYLSKSDFFHRIATETLIALADRAEVRSYSIGDVITEAGDTCRELLLLVEGDAKIHYQFADGIRVEHLHSGQMLDELEVLTHSDSENTIFADSETVRILAISVDAFDDLLDHDSDFARRVLELESWHLQRFMRSVQPI